MRSTLLTALALCATTATAAEPRPFSADDVRAALTRLSTRLACARFASATAVVAGSDACSAAREAT